MMDELKIKIPEELFVPTESSCFSGQWKNPSLLFGSDEYCFKDPLQWNVSIFNVGDALLVTGTVNGVAEIACARCLEDFTYEFNGTVEDYFLLNEEARDELELGEDEFEFLAKDKIIDLEPLLKAALLLEVPLMPLCAEDCKGLCQVCGQNLNKKSCLCASENDVIKKNPFAILKDFPVEK